MKYAGPCMHHARTLRPWQRDRGYVLYTRILGSTVELHATHLVSGERFISRAESWENAVEALDLIMRKYGPGYFSPANSDSMWNGVCRQVRQGLYSFLSCLRRCRAAH